MFYCMYNGHADITRMVDESGELAEKYYYDEWGAETESLKYGDLTGDGNVNINDYSLLKRHIYIKEQELSPEQKIVSDLTGDGKTDTEDLNILKQIISADIKSCPADTNMDGFINEKNNIKYAGYFYDGETGLYYLNARFYDPETARFIQEDTYSGDILDPLSLNLYTYGHNNPISYYDPTGHSIKSVLKKAVSNTAKKVKEKITQAVTKTATVTASTVKRAATTTKNAVVKASTNFWNDWQSGVDQLKSSGTAGRIFANYSEGVVGSLDNMAAGAVQLSKDPLGTISESVNYFIEDPVRNNPLAAVGKYYKDIAQASYVHDWDTVAQKIGSGTANLAVVGATGGLTKNAVLGKLPNGIKVNIKVPKFEMLEYAGMGMTAIKTSVEVIPVSISSGTIATAAGVTASGVAAQGIVYNSKFNGSAGAGNASGDGTSGVNVGKRNSKSLLPEEGKVGTFDELNALRKKGDNLTPHHMPSGEYIISKGKAYGDGIAMWMEQPFPGKSGRHRNTFTYGKRKIQPEMQDYLNLSPRDALAKDIWDARRVYRDDRLYTKEIKANLKDVIAQNKQSFPDLYDK